MDSEQRARELLAEELFNEGRESTATKISEGQTPSIITGIALRAIRRALEQREAVPVAWMRDSGVPVRDEAWCITDRVKNILQAATPDKVERYTIPLYNIPLPQGDVVAWEFTYCNRDRMVWFERPPSDGDMDKVFSKIRPLVYGDATPPRDVPEGWVLVPTDTTAAMEDAGLQWLTAFQHMRKQDRRNAISNAYRAMLAAAPSEEVG